MSTAPASGAIHGPAGPDGSLANATTAANGKTPAAVHTTKYPPTNVSVDVQLSPRLRVTMRCAMTIGPIVGNIIATIIVSHMPTNTAAPIAIGIRVPIWPSPITMSVIAVADRTVRTQARV